MVFRARKICHWAGADGFWAFGPEISDLGTGFPGPMVLNHLVRGLKISGPVFGPARGPKFWPDSVVLETMIGNDITIW